MKAIIYVGTKTECHVLRPGEFALGMTLAIIILALCIGISLWIGKN